MEVRTLDGPLGAFATDRETFQGYNHPGQITTVTGYATEGDLGRNLRFVQGADDNSPTLHEGHRGVFDVH